MTDDMASGAPGDSGVEFRVTGLHKAFGDHRVLTGIDMEIRRGEFVAIVGGSGCGKTVLLNHILGQLEPDAGEVWVADHAQPGAPLVDLARLADEEPMELDRLHARWGVVFQRNALFSGSVLDNIALWLREVRNMDESAIETIARRVLGAVHLPTDDGFLATLTEELSGGMAKRVAVARALSMDPVVLFYDEPTTGLDPVSASQVQDLVLATHNVRGQDGGARTTIVITHDKDLLSRLHPRTVMLHDGKVLFDGPFGEFESSVLPAVRPYFDLMPVLHGRRG